MILYIHFIDVLPDSFRKFKEKKIAQDPSWGQQKVSYKLIYQNETTYILHDKVKTYAYWYQ